MEYLAQNFKVREQFGKESRKLVEKDLSEKIVIDKTITIYQKILFNTGE